MVSCRLAKCVVVLGDGSVKTCPVVLSDCHVVVVVVVVVVRAVVAEVACV